MIKFIVYCDFLNYLYFLLFIGNIIFMYRMVNLKFFELKNEYINLKILIFDCLIKYLLFDK